MRNVTIAGAALLTLCAAAVTAPKPGQITRQGDMTLIGTPEATVGVTPLNSNIFRVTTFPSGTNDFTLPKSQSAVMEANPSAANCFFTPDEVVWVTPTTTVRVDRATGKVSFFDNEGDLLLSESEGVDNSQAVKRVSFAADAKENFYATGDRGHRLRLNGDTLVMYNRQNYGYTEGDPRISQMNITVPYFVSDVGYGVLFDDYNDARLYLGDSIVYTSETPKPLSYYFINGEYSLAGATSGYSELTGRQDLPPFWAMGYITSKYGYHNQDETLGAIDSLKTRGYPVDGIVLDLYWYGTETDMGRLEWDKKQWPDHKKMLSQLKEKGVNLVAINQPYINKIGAIDNYNFLADKGMLTKDSAGNTHDVTTWVGEAGMFDLSNPDTRQWMWQRLKGLTADGMAGWWGDLGEPEVHPLSIVHANGETASQYHNVYGNQWSQLIYDGLRKDFPDMRPLLLMRGGTAGLQRYSVFPWTTDVSRSWGGMQPQVKLMLSAGLSGLGYMSSDVGGFAVDPKHPYDPELYVRWLQMGTFAPILRTHAQYKPEPYHYPAQEKITKSFIRQRYEWLPYNYTLAYENAAMGLPLARPLNFNGGDDVKYSDVEDEYLWGDEVLVAPVMKAGARSRKVVFPSGRWINWNNTRLSYKGGTTAVVAAPLDQLPMFVKAGSFIPLYKEPIENTTEYNPMFLTVKYFPADEETSYTLFDDDRKSPTSLSDDNYQLTTFTGRREGRTINISLSAEGRYEGMPQMRMITMEVEGVGRRPGSVMLDGMKLESAASPKAIRQYGYTYNPGTRTLTIRFPWNYSECQLAISN